MNACFDCGFWDSEREGCSCSSFEKWYACPIESQEPENQQSLQEYAEWTAERKALDEIEREAFQKDYYLYNDDIVENIRQIIRKLRGTKNEKRQETKGL